MYKVRGNYSSCTCRSSENLCSSNGGAQEKRKDRVKTGWKLSLAQKVGAFLSLTPGWRLLYFCGGFLKISPGFGPNSEYWCRVFMTLLENSTTPWKPVPRSCNTLKGYQKSLEWYPLKFSEYPVLSWERTGFQALKRVSFYVKPPGSHYENRTETL